MSRHHRRVNRTRKDMRQAFLTLSLQKDISLITVKDIVEEADYNRTTFYVHYKDKFDLMNDFMNVSIEGIIQAIKSPYNETKIIDLATIQSNALVFIDYIYEHKQAVKVLLDKKHFSTFEELLTSSILEINLNDVYLDDPSYEIIDKEIYFRMHTKTLIALIEYWAESDYSHDIEYIKSQLKNFWKIRNTVVKFK